MAFTGRWSARPRHTEYTMFTRITRRVAERMFANGYQFAMCPRRLRPGYPWAPHCTIHPKDWVERHHGDVTAAWEAMVRNWEYYNASWEAGYYPAFYVEHVAPLATVA